MHSSSVLQGLAKNMCPGPSMLEFKTSEEELFIQLFLKFLPHAAS